MWKLFIPSGTHDVYDLNYGHLNVIRTFADVELSSP